MRKHPAFRHAPRVTIIPAHNSYVATPQLGDCRFVQAAGGDLVFSVVSRCHSEPRRVPRGDHPMPVVGAYYNIQEHHHHA